MTRRLPNGVWILDGDSHFGTWIADCGRLDHDQPLLTRLQAALALPKDAVIVDAGAYIGDHTVAYLAWAPQGRVIAFEPMPDACSALRMNCPMAEVHQLALGAEHGMAMLCPAAPNYGASYLAYSGGGPSVAVIPLDELALERLDYLKVDVEGWEVQLLQGALTTLRRCRPAILIEINRGALLRAGSSDEQLYRLLEDLGYVRFPGWPWTPDSLQQDLLFIPKPKEPAP